jgi:hypothetical protein
MRPTGITIFISYARVDEPLRLRLDTHLSSLKREGLIETWHDLKIGPGEEWQPTIEHVLNVCQVVLLLISADFLASDYCWCMEMNRALERHKKGEVCVIPVILKHSDWETSPFSKLAPLPSNGKPITAWNDQEEAFLEVAKGIRSAIALLPSARTPETVAREAIQVKPQDDQRTLLSGLNSLLAATQAEEEQYSKIRTELLRHSAAAHLPSIMKDRATHKEFLDDLQSNHRWPKERSTFINRTFAPIRQALDGERGVTAEWIAVQLKSFGAAGVKDVWDKGLERCERNDFDGAITLARTLLEKVCRHILEKHGAPPPPNKHTLPDLYRLVARQVPLSSDDGIGNVIREILGSCQHIVTGVGTLRNRMGDAHAGIPTDRYHAELAVQLAGAISIFLLGITETSAKGFSA